MKQLTDEQIEEMARQEQLLLVCDDLEALTEIVRATERALDTAQPVQVNAMLVEALKRIVFTVPVLDGAGGLFFEHHGFDGEYLGVEQIDPMWVIQEMAGVAQSALAQAEGGV